MGQSVTRKPRPQPVSETLAVEFAVFETACGWMGVLGRNATVQHLRLGYESLNELRRDLTAAAPPEQLIGEADWYPELRDMLQAYAAGQRVSFANIRCESPAQTEFQRQVINYVKRVPFGKVVSYGDVAQAVGYPGAARAVGTVMSSNRIPLIIPCHRVVAAGGKLGGYSSPRGSELKQWLLDLERSASLRRPR